MVWSIDILQAGCLHRCWEDDKHFKVHLNFYLEFIVFRWRGLYTDSRDQTVWLGFWILTLPDFYWSLAPNYPLKWEFASYFLDSQRSTITYWIRLNVVTLLFLCLYCSVEFYKKSSHAAIRERSVPLTINQLHYWYGILSSLPFQISKLTKLTKLTLIFQEI